jgi:hypothetical protein
MSKPILVVFPDLIKAHVDQYTRSDGTVVQAHDDKRQAAAPALGTHANALRESSKPDHMDHWSNQVAAQHMAAGDHKALAGHLQSMDTAARDHVLEHIHPDHHEGLGFKTLNHARSVAGYEKKFSAAPIDHKRRIEMEQKHGKKMTSDGSSWRTGGLKIKNSDAAGIPEFSHKQVYGTDHDSKPGQKFSKDFDHNTHKAFVVKHSNGEKSYVDTEGFNHARYHAPVGGNGEDSDYHTHKRIAEIASDKAWSKRGASVSAADHEAAIKHHEKAATMATALGASTYDHDKSIAEHKRTIESVKGHAAASAKPPMSADDVSNHAVSAGAKSKSGVAVFSSADRAHSYSNKSANSKGGAFVMSHPDHSHHVVVSGADSQRMARGGYKYAKPGSSMEKSMLMVRADLLK